jgi:heterodisulfide reductase subunit B
VTTHPETWDTFPNGNLCTCDRCNGKRRSCGCKGCRTTLKAAKAAKARKPEVIKSAVSILQAERLSASADTAIAKLMAEAVEATRRERMQKKEQPARYEGFLPFDSARSRGLVKDNPLQNIGPGVYGPM